MKQLVTILFLFMFLLGLTAIVHGQNNGFKPSNERSSFEDRRKSILDANTLRATYHNYGFGGRTSEDNRDELYFEFPKNTNRRYLYFASVFTGAEVTNQQTGEPMQIVVAPNYRTDPQTGNSWAKNPVMGYFNPDSDELARSDQGPNSPFEDTWPSIWPDKMDDAADPGWPGQWNGFFGKDIFNADQEFYYRSGDDLYTRFSQDGRFIPDSNDPSRGGLGLIMDARMMSWTQNLISSVHFNIFEIRNDSEHDYNKVAFMLWTADWLGTPANDRPFFDQVRSIAFYEDTRPTNSPPEFDGTSIGVTAIRFLETPGNAIDGIDNDGDSDFYFQGGPDGLYDPINQDLYGLLIEPGGGFIADKSVLGNEVVPKFTPAIFGERQINPGDPVIFIDRDGNRILKRYPPAHAGDVTVRTFDAREQFRDVVLPAGGITLREDTVNVRHRNQIDDDLNGLIDENQPNHLTLSQFIGGTEVIRPVRYINYLWQGYYDGHNGYPGFGENSDFGWIQDESGNWIAEEFRVIQRGLIIPDHWIEERINIDENFARIIFDYQKMLKNLYSRQPSSPVFPEEFFDNYYRNQFTSAPMIDESREDFFDNNQAWEMIDDVGIDGVEGTGTRGEGDGFPSSGAFTPFPGEPNIDKTDVQETDAIGITSATIVSAGALGGGRSFLGDATIWNRYMQPGVFDQLSVSEAEAGDYDQFLTSSFFPLRRGSIERFAIAITAAQANTPTNSADIELATQQLESAFRAYDANYQFAIAPPPPLLRAVPGNGRVTLYWDDEAELVFDRFLEKIGANPRNFEGYRIYRATDAALEDARRISDGRGNRHFLQPIAQFDLENGITGNHVIPIAGSEFYLGSDTGIRRSYVDTDVINGRTYYYVVTGYNHGAASAGIAPAESPINISIAPDGSLRAGANVQRVVPSGQSAGYVGPAPLHAERFSGDATGDLFTDIIDPENLKPDTRYRVTFTSEQVSENGEIFDRTTAFHVLNVTENRYVVENQTDLDGEELFIDGIKLTVLNDKRESQAKQNALKVNDWRTNYDDPVYATVQSTVFGEDFNDYEIIFNRRAEYQTEELILDDGEEKQRISSQQVSFLIFDRNTGQRVPIAFEPSEKIKELGVSNKGGWAAYYDAKSGQTYSDKIYILDYENEPVWKLHLEPYQHNQVFELNPGEKITLKNTQEFTERDVYEFFVDSSIHIPREDKDLARVNLDNIRVVPNPYIVTNVTEPRPTEGRPTQTRQLHFTNLPAKCTIRIFTVSGRLVQTLHVNNSIDNDRFIWDMLTKDNLEISYGVYIYHVSASDVGEKVGKFAVIK